MFVARVAIALYISLIFVWFQTKKGSILKLVTSLWLSRTCTNGKYGSIGGGACLKMDSSLGSLVILLYNLQFGVSDLLNYLLLDSCLWTYDSAQFLVSTQGLLKISQFFEYTQISRDVKPIATRFG